MSNNTQGGAGGTGGTMPISEPYLVIEFKGSNGLTPAEPLLPPIKILVPRQLSARIAVMHVKEYLGKALKKGVTIEAMKVIGLK